ncbi:MAG: hypothetical protein J6C85_06775, partial [Alphaproteobacteria bacterium]|nr:hypothetical protein [Alphaproteobacteria bacterium]
MKKSILFTLLCGTFLSSAPVLAEEISTIPTIDRLSAEAKEFLESYTPTLHKLDENLPENNKEMVTIIINNKTYFYTPNSGEDKYKLQLLANIASNALKESDVQTDNTIYQIGDKYYSYDSSVELPKSRYTLTLVSDITEEEAKTREDIITTYVKNEDNTLTPKYYQYAIVPGSGIQDSVGNWYNELLEGSTSYNNINMSSNAIIDLISNEGGFIQGVLVLNGEISLIGDYIKNKGYILNKAVVAHFVGNFINNVSGGIENKGSILAINANFIKNTSSILSLIGNEGTIHQILNSNFYGNKMSDLIFNDDGSVIKEILNSNFYSNEATAIYSSGENPITIAAHNGNSEFIGNKTAYSGSSPLILKATNGYIDFEDVISGSNFDLSVEPYETEAVTQSASSFDEAKDDLAWVKADKLADPATYVRFNNEVSGVNNLSLADGTVMWLGTNGKINSSKMNSLGLSTLTVDVGVKDNALTAGLIETGYLSGQYQVFVNAPDTQNLEGELAQKSVVFLRAEEADENASFKVARVMKSPYLW